MDKGQAVAISVAHTSKDGIENVQSRLFSEGFVWARKPERDYRGQYGVGDYLLLYDGKIYSAYDNTIESVSRKVNVTVYGSVTEFFRALKVKKILDE